MILGIVILISVGLLAGRGIALLPDQRNRRTAGWGLVVLLIFAAHLLLLGADPVMRMVGLCAVLLAGMKSLVYAEWYRGTQLPMGRYLIFGLLWFGMDPATFATRRAGLSWKQDLGWGVLMMVLGTAGAWIVWKMEWKYVFLMFLPLSLGFHFGALRVLKAVHRRAGFPVRTLFPNPLKTRGAGDFWSRRWNIGYSQMMQRVVGRPVVHLIGPKVGLLSVFVVSGLLHEVAITLVVMKGWGLPTAYFTMHGVLVLLEGRIRQPFGNLLTLLLVILPMGWLFPAAFQSEVIARFLGVMKFLTIA